MSYVVAGYGITLVTFAVYALRLVRRARALAHTLGAEGG